MCRYKAGEYHPRLVALLVEARFPSEVQYLAVKDLLALPKNLGHLYFLSNWEHSSPEF